MRAFALAKLRDTTRRLRSIVPTVNLLRANQAEVGGFGDRAGVSDPSQDVNFNVGTEPFASYQCRRLR